MLKNTNQKLQALHQIQTPDVWERIKDAPLPVMTHQSDAIQISEVNYQQSFKTDKFYSRQMIGLAVALVLLIGLATSGVFIFGSGEDLIALTTTDEYSTQTFATNSHIETNEPYDIYPLTLNEISDTIGERTSRENYAFRNRDREIQMFSYPLTDEQLKELFALQTIDTWGEAHYLKNGELDYIYTWDVNGVRLVEIHFDSKWEYDYYDYEPVVSDVFGIPVVAGIHKYDGRISRAAYSDGSTTEYDGMYYATFEIGEVYYMLEVNKIADDDLADQKFATIVNDFVKHKVQNGNPDFSIFSDPVIPELSFEKFDSEEQARLDPDYGKYIPEAIPAGFIFDTAFYEIHQGFNGLEIRWSNNTNPTNTITFQIGKHTDYEYNPVVRNVFLAEELNLDGISNYMANLEVDSAYFFVVYDDFVVFIDPSPSMTSQQILEMLPKID